MKLGVVMPSKIKQRGKNSFQFFVPDGYDSATGKQKGFTETVQAANWTEAEKLYDLFKANCLHGKVLASGTEKMTLSQFYQYWKIHYAKSIAKHEETTLAYNDKLFERIEAVLGPLRIDQTQPRHILDFFKQISADDASYKDMPLNTNTLRKYYILLNTLFSMAVQWKYVVENVMGSINPPKYVKPKKEILNDKDLAKYFEELENETTKHQLWILIAFTRGLRREEICGLKWGDLDFAKNKMSINRAIVYVPGKPLIEKDTKTDNSHRTLSMPRSLAQLFLVWKEELNVKVKKRNKRKKILSIVDPTGPDKWVFPQANGNCGHPCSITTFVRRFYIDNDLKKSSPHLFRHMSGSYMLREGIDIAAISAELGHGDKSFTMKTYIHEIEGEQEKAASAMENVMERLKPNKVVQIKKGQA